MFYLIFGIFGISERYHKILSQQYLFSHKKSFQSYTTVTYNPGQKAVTRDRGCRGETPACFEAFFFKISYLLKKFLHLAVVRKSASVTAKSKNPLELSVCTRNVAQSFRFPNANCSGRTNLFWEVEEKNLKTLTENLRKLNPKNISIVSVLGAYRTGKSFLLNLMKQYLQKNGAKDWLSGTIDGESKSNFRSKHQEDRVTTGLWVYSQPFLVGETAVVLMDTQGLFDFQTEEVMEINKAIFSLSTLFSS